VKLIDSGDRASPENAKAVFKSLFTGAVNVSIVNVYQLVPAL
jgi:hypothetical protein